MYICMDVRLQQIEKDLGDLFGVTLVEASEKGEMFREDTHNLIVVKF